MSETKRLVKYSCWILLILSIAACTPKLTFYVTRPTILPVENIENISMGKFEDEMDANITLPLSVNGKRLKNQPALHPKIIEFKSNGNAADLLRGMLVAGLSESNQYRLINSEKTDTEISGSIPNPEKTGVINVKTRYYEYVAEDAEKNFFLLLATKGGLDFREQAVLMASKAAVIASAERSKKGFQVDVPYLEKIAALEVEFDLIRKSNGEKVIETQLYRAYYTEKWGGRDDTSHLPKQLKQTIRIRNQKDRSISEIIEEQTEDIQQALLDPQVFLAKGGKLIDDPTVPMNSLEIKSRLARQVVSSYLKQISRYTEETTLKIASGDPIAVNYIKANAYEMAINRLENLERTVEDSFNLALAYESIAEINQAARYYQEALDKDPNNSVYQEALKRVRR